MLLYLSTRQKRPCHKGTTSPYNPPSWGWSSKQTVILILMTLIDLPCFFVTLYTSLNSNPLISPLQAFTIMLVYVWARRNSSARMNFFGLLTFNAPYLPWVLLCFSILLGNSIAVDVLGAC